MNVTPSYRNSPFTLKAMPSSKSVGVDFGAVMKARQETAEAMNPKQPQSELVSGILGSKNMLGSPTRPVKLNYGIPGTGEGNALGYSYYAKYAEGHTEENPIITIEWTDPDNNEYTEDIVLSDINPRNATFIEMAALNAHLKPKKTTFGSVAMDNANIPYDRKMNQIAGFEKAISTAQMLGNIRSVQDYSTQMNAYLDFFAKAKATKTSVA